MKESMMAMHSLIECIRPPIPTTFASLCSRANFAVSGLQARAARTPFTLLAAICSPFPEPPRTIPSDPKSVTVANTYDLTFTLTTITPISIIVKFMVNNAITTRRTYEFTTKLNTSSGLLDFYYLIKYQVVF